jgi:glycosyltransferase involved in cell wall biosynthesis
MRNFNVCIDGFNLSLAKGSGIATYARNLTSTLQGLGHQTQILYGPTAKPGSNNLLNEIALFDAKPVKGDAFARRFARALVSPFGRKAKSVRLTGEIVSGPSNVSTPAVWSAQDVFHSANRSFNLFGQFTPLSFAETPDAARPDVFHWTCALPMHAKRASNLYTIHDLVPLRLPYTTLDNKSSFHAMCERICRDADQIVTVSEHSKRDIIRIFGVDERRVFTTYQAVDVPKALRMVDDTEVMSEIEGVFGLGWRRYFLYFGAVEPKKNIARIIEAYLAANVGDPLIIVGGKGWLDEEQTELMYDDIVMRAHVGKLYLQRSDRIRRYKYLPFPALVNLIRGAKAVMFPSLYEGFGLPILEAMQLGTPTLASTGGSLPEVAGDAAMLVDPFDARAIKRALIALDSDEGLRTCLSERGLKQAAKFSPEKYSEKVAELYQRIS